MNTNPLRCLGAWVIGLTVAFSSIDADAGPPFINGSISFVGTPVPNGPLLTATAFTNFTSVFVSAVGSPGSYSNVPVFTAASWTPFSFSPPVAPVVPLWAFTNGGLIYSLDATSVTMAYRTNNVVDIQGSGIAHITGFADTPSTWIFAANQNSSSYVFSATTYVSPTNVPVLQSVTHTNGTISFAWNAIAGQPYQVEYITNLTQLGWSNLDGVITTTNPIATASDTIGTSRQRFYRVLLLP
jgi:hypothetical protein